jgi:hypothetical protein
MQAKEGSSVSRLSLRTSRVFLARFAVKSFRFSLDVPKKQRDDREARKGKISKDGSCVARLLPLIYNSRFLKFQAMGRIRE